MYAGPVIAALAPGFLIGLLLHRYAGSRRTFLIGGFGIALSLLLLLIVWLQIDGPSGVGKSSLVKAGMIPAIQRGWLEQPGAGPAVRWGG